MFTMLERIVAGQPSAPVPKSAASVPRRISVSSRKGGQSDAAATLDAAILKVSSQSQQRSDRRGISVENAKGAPNAASERSGADAGDIELQNA